MRYFISAANANHGVVQRLSVALSLMGHTCGYDTANAPDMCEKKEAELVETSFNLVQSIRDAELFISVCPTTKTTSLELGLALASKYGKRIIVWSTNGSEFEPGNSTYVYYCHHAVTRFVGSYDEFIEYLQAI